MPKDRPQAPCLQPGQEVSIVSSSRRPNNAIGRGGPTLLPCVRPHCTSGRLLPANSCRAATKRVYTHTHVYTHTRARATTRRQALSAACCWNPRVSLEPSPATPTAAPRPRWGVPPPAQEHTPPSPAPPWPGKPRRTRGSGQRRRPGLLKRGGSRLPSRPPAAPHLRPRHSPPEPPPRR